MLLKSSLDCLWIHKNKIHLSGRRYLFLKILDDVFISGPSPNLQRKYRGSGTSVTATNVMSVCVAYARLSEKIQTAGHTQSRKTSNNVDRFVLLSSFSLWMDLSPRLWVSVDWVEALSCCLSSVAVGRGAQDGISWSPLDNMRFKDSVPEGHALICQLVKWV